MKHIHMFLMTVVFAALTACGGSSSDSDTQNQSLVFPTSYAKSPAGDLRPEETGVVYNLEAIVPPQCYTKHEATHNPCMICHQTYTFGSRPNYMSDKALQAEYSFSEIGVTNHWQNLFEDRSDAVSQISDQEVIDYIYTDNYSTLIEQLQSDSWDGPVPAIQDLHLGAGAFDDQGFALDGSHWVAFNYKPLPSTFWPTNGSTDDVMLRLPAAFREQSCNGSGYSRDTYIANLAILEAAIQELQRVSLPQVDENSFCTDLNGDGQLGVINEIIRPDAYVGNASNVSVTPMLYPEGTEFLHTVRYIGLDEDMSINIPARMKEVRYMVKQTFYTPAELLSMYGNEKQEKLDGNLPNFVSRGDNGLDNGFGWLVLGFIEGADGHLRKQSEEETTFCMGCHTSIGSTIDQTFAFPRKVTGASGWGYINLKGMLDAPNVGGTEGEILNYLKLAGGGNEFRENNEIIQKWFNEDGSVNEEKVLAADVYELLAPSPERALTLNKAYMAIVRDQDFIHGRDANVTPAVNVYDAVDPEIAPVLPTERQYDWDMRLAW
ncbi:MAG: hypothetical protein B6D77_09950 [gamma proteobacterium symbiont of Ctena orbiculata]|nr:MAG: hypothetical protein DBP02_02705 [gamma proteobacterium symbiont of Ctena orbiculata]PUB87997.1 MAG: hypothetical protein DBP01_12415 [gamma proteobacterium symbiont of Ctena orbiculata]PVV09569.1 MAG: hypothetical protein B6D77_09950 [gamma proteobacterium symbiont of Ctena orbiculata]PVV19408.1 MAG: hypothetical protein B6D78_13740 [gamma proteobacterium symbiont of Ctena orbiculata]